MVYRALVALCLSAQLATVGHFALVTHTRCLEHGELVHADEHEHHVLADLGESEADDTWHVGSAEDAHEEGHDHCVASHDRRKGWNVAPAALIVARAHVVRAFPPVQRALAPACQRYRFAPKTSPPSA